MKLYKRRVEGTSGGCQVEVRWMSGECLVNVRWMSGGSQVNPAVYLSKSPAKERSLEDSGKELIQVTKQNNYGKDRAWNY